MYLLTQGQQGSHVIDDCDCYSYPEHDADPSLPTPGLVKLHNDCQADDARRRKYRGIRTGDRVFQPFDHGFEVLNVCPNLDIPSFHLTQYTVDSSRQFNSKFSSIHGRITQATKEVRAGKCLVSQLADHRLQVIGKTQIGVDRL